MKPEQPACFQQGAARSGRAQQFIAGRGLNAVTRCDLDQPACHIGGVARCRDVVMAHSGISAAPTYIMRGALGWNRNLPSN